MGVKTTKPSSKYLACEDGRSICLLIKGLQPSFEITPLWLGKPVRKSEQLKARVKVIADKEDVVKIEGQQ